MLRRISTDTTRVAPLALRSAVGGVARLRELRSGAALAGDEAVPAGAELCLPDVPVALSFERRDEVVSVLRRGS
jgi:hypothetical protein